MFRDFFDSLATSLCTLTITKKTVHEKLPGKLKPVQDYIKKYLIKEDIKTLVDKETEKINFSTPEGNKKQSLKLKRKKELESEKKLNLSFNKMTIRI